MHLFSNVSTYVNNLISGVLEAPGRPLTVAFTSRSVNLSWAPPFNAEEVGVDKYLIEIRAGEETSWKDGSILPTPDNVTLYQVNSILYCC